MWELIYFEIFKHSYISPSNTHKFINSWKFWILTLNIFQSNIELTKVVIFKHGSKIITQPKEDLIFWKIQTAKESHLELPISPG